MARRIAEEASVVVGLVLSTLYLFARFANTVWGQLFLFNGDSLLLPILDRSIERGEPLQWVFSAPLFFFPEGPIYFLCDALAPSVQWALILNGIVNILLLYAMLRTLASRVTRDHRLGMAVAALMTILIFAFVVAERDTQPAGAFASMLLFNTYYIGVILAGLSVLYLISTLRPREVGRRFWITVAGVFALTACASASNPLFVIQVVTPLIASLGLMLGIRALALRIGAWTIGSLVLGVAVAVLLRSTLLSELIVADVDGYVNDFDLGAGLSDLRHIAADGLDNSLQRYEIVVLIVGVLASFAAAGWTVTRRRPAAMPIPAALLVFFGALSGPATIGSIVVANNVMTRYMIPLVVFPYLALVPLIGSLESSRIRTKAVTAASIGLAGFSVVGVTSLGTVRTFAEERPQGSSCLQTNLAQNGARNGVANYWRARALDVYSDDARILQVNMDLTPFMWLTNEGAYQDKDFTFVLVDTPPSSPYTALPAETVTSQLGPPTSDVSCGEFAIYFYDPASVGHAVLNERIDAALD